MPLLFFDSSCKKKDRVLIRFITCLLINTFPQRDVFQLSFLAILLFSQDFKDLLSDLPYIASNIMEHKISLFGESAED